MSTKGNAELTTSARHSERLSKPGTLIYNYKAVRKTRRRTQAIAKRYAFHANAVRFPQIIRIVFIVIILIGRVLFEE